LGDQVCADSYGLSLTYGFEDHPASILSEIEALIWAFLIACAFWHTISAWHASARVVK
jgi:hypothetical protein